MHKLKALCACLCLFSAAMAQAAPILTFSAAQHAGAGGANIEVIVAASGVAPAGLSAIHFDLSFGSPGITLLSASAGSFFTLNDPAQSLWTDNVSAGLVEGVQVASNVTNAATTPDALGFDFLELLGTAATSDGEVVRLLFSAADASAARFLTNDVVLIDAVGNAFEQASQELVPSGGLTVPEPSTLALTGVALLALLRRRTGRSSALIHPVQR